MNGLPSYDFASEDRRCDEADQQNAADAADKHFAEYICQRCQQPCRHSDLTRLSMCCGWSIQSSERVNARGGE
jgi:hypothetical protein